MAKSKNNLIINFDALNMKLRNQKYHQLQPYQDIYQPNQPTKEGEPLPAAISEEIYKCIKKTQDSDNSKADKLKSENKKVNKDPPYIKYEVS